MRTCEPGQDRHRAAPSRVGDPARVFSKEELQREVWGFRYPDKTRTLDSHASRLRRKLDPDHGRFVINSWGVGYRLIDGVGPPRQLHAERLIEQ